MSSLPQPPVSGIVITYNEASCVALALSSMRPWCAELLVVDSHSTDRTREIAKEYGARVMEHDFHSFTEQKNVGVDAALNDWILSLDADEQVLGDPSLLAEINWKEDSTLYRFKRKNYYLGGWVNRTGWRRDRSVRLFNRRRARFSGDTVHETVRGDGCSIRDLNADLVHHPYNDLSHHLEKINRYTSGMAAQVALKPRAVVLSKLIFNPPWKFVKEFILEGGILMGWRGLVISTMASVYVFMKYAKAWERQRAARPTQS